MKAKLLLFLAMAICLASGVKAQFYDSADDICFYVLSYHECDNRYYRMGSWWKVEIRGNIRREIPEENKAEVYVFNFDGMKAAMLSSSTVAGVKNTLLLSPSFYEDAVETTDYKMKYEKTTSHGVLYNVPNYNGSWLFTNDRNTLIRDLSKNDRKDEYIYKRVDKSYFKVGRSRIPSGKLQE